MGIFLSEQHPASRRWAVLEDDGLSAWLYLTKMKELGKRRDAESQRKLKEMSVCAMQCVSQWMTCAQK